MDKSIAIAKLQECLNKLGNINIFEPRDQAFFEWRNNTEIVLEYVFGKRSRQLNTFRDTENIYYKFENDFDKYLAYPKELEYVTNVVQKLLDEVREYWPEPPAASLKRAGTLSKKNINGLKNGDVLSTAFFEYKIIKQLGQGGAGTVYRASIVGQEEMSYAIKLLKEPLNTEKFKRFKNELAFGLLHKHANIINPLDYGETGNGSCFYVMKYYEYSLRHIIVDDNIPVTEKLRIFNQILDGVSFYQALGIIHRDLKPENILVDASLRDVVIADFGIAHFEDKTCATDIKTKHDARLANFAYAAPEQRVKKGDVTPAADIYALGLILNEMFTGITPAGTNYKKISDSIPGLYYLDDIVAKAISSNVSGRYPDAKTMKDSISDAHPLAFHHVPCEELRDTTMHFWGDRMGPSFPDASGVTEYTDKQDIINRLDVFFREPLGFGDNNWPLWYFYDDGDGAIEHYKSDHENNIAYIDHFECDIKKLVVFDHPTDWRNFLYLELLPLKPFYATSDFHFQDVAFYNGERISLAEVESGFLKPKNGMPSRINKDHLLQFSRIVKPFNFVVAPQGSPFIQAMPEFELKAKSLLTSILHCERSILDLKSLAQHMPKPDFYS